MTNPVYIVDVIGTVVSNVQDDVLSTIQANEAAVLEDGTLIQAIDYQYGHVEELIETLSQKDKGDITDQQSKYPLIWLVQDFTEDRGKQPGIYAELSLSIIIAHQTVNTYKSTDRYTNVFKPVLYPIYYSLIQQLNRSPFVNQGNEDLIPHRKIDRLYWGAKQLSNKLNDYCDAIEITNLNLKIDYQACLVVAKNN